MAANPWGVNTSGGPMSLGASAGSLQATDVGSTQRPQTTFAQMQKQGVARPPAPQQTPSGAPPQMVPGGTMVNAQPGYPRPQIDPRQIQQPPASIPRAPAPGYQQPQFNLGQLLQQALGHPAQVNQNNGPLGGNISQQLVDLLHNPSAYNSDVAQQTFDRLNRSLSEGFDLQRQGIREEMARRGLGDSTIYGGRLGDVAIQQGRAQSDLAGQIATQQAQQYAQDRAQALAAAMGYNSGQQNYGLNQFQANQGAQQQALQNLLGYGQQSFNNQVTTQQLNNDQAQQQLNFVLQLLGMV